MLSAGLLLLEIGFGEHDGTEELRGKTLEIGEHHVVRAFDLLLVLMQQRDAWVSDGTEASATPVAAEPTQQQRQSAIATVPPAVGGAFGAWVPTQPGRPVGTVEDDLTPTLHDAPPSLDHAQAEGTPPASEEAVLLATDPGVPSLEQGYGPDGTSVQDG